MNKKTLYLASQSKYRQHLLDIAKIPYVVIDHTSNECIINNTNNLHNYVLAIAKHKMEHAVLPKASHQTIYILTADTLVQTTKTKEILGKPKDKNDAMRMHKLFRKESVELATGCCLERKEYKNQNWQTLDSQCWVTPAIIEFSVDEKMMDCYFQELPHVLKVCGAAMVDGFGLNFLKHINGSFTSILGLPLFELRKALDTMNFFD